MSIKKFGKRIKELREAKNFTQEHLAELVGIETNTLSRIENGTNFTTFDNIEHIANFLNVEIKDLFDYEHYQSKKELIKNINEKLQFKSEKEIQYIYKILIDVLCK